jgi:molecular chaperone DnaJ
MKNYYQVLEVSQDSTQDQIKASYRRLAMKYHPDKNPNDKEAEQKFKEINEANDVLSDEQKRKRYDYSINNDLNSYLKGFWKSSNPDVNNTGVDVVVKHYLDIEEVFSKNKININIETNKICNHCDGEKHKKGAKKSTCNKCLGTGRVERLKKFMNLSVDMSLKYFDNCSDCSGFGYTFSKEDSCQACQSKGLIDENISLSVSVPYCSDGMSFVLEGMGKYSTSKSKKGRCILITYFKEHSLFKILQNNIFLDVYISPKEAVFGTTIKVPTVDGQILDLAIKPGVFDKYQINLKGMGMPFGRSQRGSMFVVVNIELPDISKMKDLTENVYDSRIIENENTLSKVYKTRQKISDYISKRSSNEK